MAKHKVRICCKKKFTTYKDYIGHRKKYHAEKRAKSQDSTHRNKYGQTGKEFNDTLRKQKNRCIICKRKAGLVELHQDHNHAIEKLKIRVEVNKKHGKQVFTAINDLYRYAYRSSKKKKAIRMVRLKLKRRSRRGALCWHCNSGLRKWQQKQGWIDPKQLHKAAEYVEYWQKKQKWEKKDV